MLTPDLTTFIHRDLIIALATRYRLPAVYPRREWVIDGGLRSYGTDRVDTYRQAAFYVDRILRGAVPADLPVQAPVKYEMFQPQDRESTRPDRAARAASRCRRGD